MTARDTVVIAGGGVASAIAYGVLSWTSRTAGHVSLWIFFSCLAIAGGIALGLYYRLRRVPLSRAAVIQVILWAGMFRLIGFVGAPLYEDDFYRYLWDGRTFALTGNPYAHAPADSFGDDRLPEKFQNILSRINYPEVPTIYGPVCQFAFLAAYGLAPGELWGLKAIFIAADLCIVWLLWRLAGDSAALLLYAWSPLVIKEVAFTAHTDVLAALFLLIAVMLARKSHPQGAGVSLALAVASKVLAFLAVAFLLARRRWLSWAVFAAVVLVLYLPFLGVRTELGGLGTFASEWEFNSFGFGLLKAVVGSDAARSVSMLLFVAFYLWYFATRQNEPNLVLVFGVFFLLAPVVNPWYLLIIAPLVALRPEPWSVVALHSVLLSYVTAGNLNHGGGAALFNHPWWVRPLEILPVIGAIAWQFRQGRRCYPAEAPPLFVETKGTTS